MSLDFIGGNLQDGEKVSVPAATGMSLDSVLLWRKLNKVSVPAATGMSLDKSAGSSGLILSFSSCRDRNVLRLI
jgi:hypothetical protein